MTSTPEKSITRASTATDSPNDEKRKRRFSLYLHHSIARTAQEVDRAVLHFPATLLPSLAIHLGTRHLANLLAASVKTVARTRTMPSTLGISLQGYSRLLINPRPRHHVARHNPKVAWVYCPHRRRVRSRPRRKISSRIFLLFRRCQMQYKEARAGE